MKPIVTALHCHDCGRVDDNTVYPNAGTSYQEWEAVRRRMNQRYYIKDECSACGAPALFSYPAFD